ncbi:hypothetical protein L3X38_037657 [Prunus dulcis]|uniref:Uncharacterized protein n=1 Tax=Prunus dulcis TaxID=3755 RepID=A0AAD4YQU1_PRUDU|nr:hypothetical protein L3X38_037657 [Prunus dulcis]
MILSSLGWADAPPQGFVPGPGYILTSAQKASHYIDARVAQRTGPTPPSKILSALGWADAPPQGFVPGPGYILTSAQKASPRSEWRSGLDPTLPSMILSSLGWADAPPQGFVPGPGYILTSAQKASHYIDARDLTSPPEQLALSDIGFLGLWLILGLSMLGSKLGINWES